MTSDTDKAAVYGCACALVLVLFIVAAIVMWNMPELEHYSWQLKVILIVVLARVCPGPPAQRKTED